MSFDSRALGTPSALWESDFRFSLAEEIDLDDVRELVVIAAHPDDETLGAGGLIALAADRGVPVHVIVVTDGAGSHPRSPSVSGAQLGARRAQEVRSAVAELAPGARVSLLDFPDGHAAEFAPQIASRLRAHLSAIDGHAHVAVVWDADGHPDHETVGRVVHQVAPSAATILSYPIWMWHWGHPDTDALPWELVRSVVVPEPIQLRKRRAIAAFVSQIEPLSSAPGDERVLEPDVLQHFARDRELYLVTRDGTV